MGKFDRSGPPALTTLSYSAGVQSHAILEMVLRGHLPLPAPFAVINANPGMENSESLRFVAEARRRCQEAGIKFVTAEGPNLYEGLLNLKAGGKTRFDLPPLFVKREDGKEGRLAQRCTKQFKIQPMRRAVRRILFEMYGVPMKSSHVPNVETWIGFAADETRRVKDDVPGKKGRPSYVRLRYPLIELGLDRVKVEGYYLQHDILKPPRSVCNACPANGIKYYESMARERPEDFEQACKANDAIRDLSCVGVKCQAFFSPALVGLREMEERGFTDDPKLKAFRCNKGVCFL